MRASADEIVTKHAGYKTAQVRLYPSLHTQFVKGEFVAVKLHREFEVAPGLIRRQYLVAKSQEGLQDALDRCVIFDESALHNFCF